MITQKHCIAADVTSKDGAKPQKEYSPGQRPGYKCTYYPARCKRKRSQWNTRSLLPVALSERELFDSLLPRALPWAGFLLGFQPVFAACKPFIQDKTTEFQTKWGSGNNISHHSNGRATERHGCVVNTREIPVAANNTSYEPRECRVLQ